MASTDLSDVKKIRLHVELGTYFIPCQENVGGTAYELLTTAPPGAATVPDYFRLPHEMDAATMKRVYEKWNTMGRDGNPLKKVNKLIGFEYKAKFAQRDVDTYEFDRIWSQVQGVFLCPLHRNTVTAKQQYLGIFGSIEPSDADVSTKEGSPEFIFTGETNKYAITIKAAGNLVPPVLSPPVDITIAQGGIYKLVEITIP